MVEGGRKWEGVSRRERPVKRPLLVLVLAGLVAGCQASAQVEAGRETAADWQARHFSKERPTEACTGAAKASLAWFLQGFVSGPVMPGVR